MARILTVEDEPTILKMVAQTLRSLGHEVLTATNGREGLEMVLRHRPHLVVSDINMPEMDGFAFLSELRAQHRQFADMPFIFLSALSERKDIIAGRALGSDDYVTKPVDLELLIAVVQSRLLQVERMQTHKEEQMVRLYRALSAGKDADPSVPIFALDDATPAPGPLPPAHRVVLVADRPRDFDGVVRTMRDAGLQVDVSDSGGELVDLARSGAPDLVVITYNTTDQQAPIAVNSARRVCDFNFPALLLVPQSMQAILRGQAVKGFESQINLPASDRAVLSIVHSLLTTGRAAG